jgi:hypothetical protein
VKSVFPWALAIAFAVALRSADSDAAPTAEESRTALTLAREGKIAYEANYAVALEKFEAADALVHTPVLSLYLARCLRKLARYAEAEAVLEATLAQELAADADPLLLRGQRDAAVELAELRQLPRLRLQERGLVIREVFVDGESQPLPPDRTLRVEPGVHEVHITAGDQSFRYTVQVEPNQEEVLTVSLPAADESERESSDVPRIEPPESPRHGPLRGVRIGLWATAAVGLGLGAGAGAVAWARSKSLRDQCLHSPCPETLRDDWRVARSWGHVSTAGFVLGGAAALGGGVLFLTTRSSAAVGPAGVSVTTRF